MECGEIRSFCYGRCLLIMINTKKNRKEHKNMLTLILDLFSKLRNCSQSKAKTNVKVDVEQKITVVTIIVDNER